MYTVRERTPPDKLRGVSDAEDFYDHFEPPVVLPYIQGFAGLDPCRRGNGTPFTDIAVDGGRITED